MSDLAIGREGDAIAQRSVSDLYRAVWRWHFYAGLLVLPFMITLAVTGALYLFRDEIDTIVHAELKRVAIQQSVVTPTAMVDAALAAYPGSATKFTTPAAADASAEITVRAPDGNLLAVYVDPYSGKVLGSLPDRGTIMWTIRTLHSLKYFGAYARMAVEIAAGWAILLVATGIYLWWPRQQTGGVVSIRGNRRQRVFWRDVHAVTGICVGSFVVFLAVTGMPWSGVWGGKINEWANGSNYGYPSGMWIDVPMSGEHLGHVTQTAWSMEQMQIPQAAQSAGKPISLDAAVAAFDRLDVTAGYAVELPADPQGVYTASVFPDDVSKQRVIHVDQYTGKPLIDVGYGNYGPLAKSLEWGINVHLGQQYGLANQLVLLGVCVCVVLLAVAAAVMWWKRRPAGSLGVPPMPRDNRVFRGLLVLLAVGGVIFPLVGASLLVMLALDWLYLRSRRRGTANSR